MVLCGGRRPRWGSGATCGGSPKLNGFPAVVDANAENLGIAGAAKFGAGKCGATAATDCAFPCAPLRNLYRLAVGCASEPSLLSFRLAVALRNQWWLQTH